MAVVEVTVAVVRGMMMMMMMMALRVLLANKVNYVPCLHGQAYFGQIHESANGII